MVILLLIKLFINLPQSVTVSYKITICDIRRESVQSNVTFFSFNKVTKKSERIETRYSSYLKN